MVQKRPVERRGCHRIEQALSARVDGEDPRIDEVVLTAHLAVCTPCAEFSAWIDEEHRKTRVRLAEPVPDLSERLLSLLSPWPAPRQALHVTRRLARRPLRVASQQGPRSRRAVAALAVVLALAGGWIAGAGLSGNGPKTTGTATNSTDTNAKYPGATFLATGVMKPNLVLTDTEGRPYDLASSTAGRITLVYFGYTHCPDVCPINMAVTAAALRRMPTQQRAMVTVVFVTTDPARDTSSVLRLWLDRFDPAFIGLTGTRARIADVERDIHMPLSYATAGNSHSENYQMVHAGYTLVYSQDNLAHLAVDVTETPSAYATTLEHVAAGGPPTH